MTIKMINSSTGAILRHPEGIEISPSITEHEFGALQFPKDRDVHSYQVNKLKHQDVVYSFITFDRLGIEFSARVKFSVNENADWVSKISYVLFTNSIVASQYEDFYKRLESTRTWHDRWMQRMLGKSPSIDFWWGRVESQSDIKAEESFISISYTSKALKMNQTGT